MKKVIFAYVLTILVFVALISVLSYGYGAGYVYLYWRDIQIQTNIWVLFALICVIALIIQAIWRVSKYYLNHEKRKVEQIFDFQSLHPYEQLGVISLLDAEIDQKDFIQQLFLKSGLLKGIIQSQLEYAQGHFKQALLCLEHTSPMAFELAEIQRIRIYLAQNDVNKALTHLEFLQGHELSPWLNDVKTSYSKTMQILWGEFAVKFPWQYLKAIQHNHLFNEHQQGWLEHLLQSFEQASDEQKEALKTRYRVWSEQLETKEYALNTLWLKLLVRLPNMEDEQEHLANILLEQQFNEDVFYLWFQQQTLKQPANYSEIETKLNYLESRYSALPILSFVKWHILQAQQKFDEAEEVLKRYPQNVLMSYLRIKNVLSDREDLLQQLNNVFENDSNHVILKI